MPRGLRARGWVLLRTTPVLSGVTRRLERLLRRDRPVEGLGIPAGRDAPVPGDGRTAPVVLLLGLGLQREAVAGWARVVAAVQADGVLLRPLWLLDGPAFAELMPYGWASDHVMPRSVYEGTAAVLDHDVYVAQRLDIWSSRTDGAAVVTLLGAPDDDPAQVARFRAVVASLSARAPAAGAGRPRSRS